MGRIVCMNGAKKERNFGGCEIGDVEQYKYLGVTVKAGLNGGFKSMGDRMGDANGVLHQHQWFIIHFPIGLDFPPITLPFQEC